ncbi:hypothetical protein [Streptomyces sp. 4R-3d]|uniref:hypothetical protein n=1 Tax=Streptomyces sp. 4R-3d TaxID=2559605 RepID=UPI001072DD95|nr:hypothetical protein [Streptomyces sp. 4R-3d]TFI30144.1 hypothetical protein E4P36_05180 [Streptomyces sp. 4R-3d]
MYLRHVTACPSTAAYTTHRQRHGTEAWRIFTCPRHRRLADWSVPGNLRRLGPGDPVPPCGTVRDHRPHAQIVVSHLHGWMGAGGWVTDLAPDDWRGHLAAAHEYHQAIGADDRTALTAHALELAAADHVPDLLALLAAAETSAARRLVP